MIQPFELNSASAANGNSEPIVLKNSLFLTH